MTGAVVIVGAGQAGFQVAASLRQRGHQGPVTLAGDEPGLPYQRPPLSKEVLAGAAAPETTALRPEAFFAKHDIALRSGQQVVGVDRDRRTVTLSSGAALDYDHLVLATGARPRALPKPGADLDGVLALRTLDDAVAIRDRVTADTRVVVIGAGFIGLEVAAGARKRGAEVTVLEVAPRVMGRALSAPSAAHLVGRHERAGASIRTGARIGRIADDGHGRAAGVVLAGGELLHADLVIVGVGVAPATDVAEQAGLPVDDGVLVDATLRTEDPHIWAIGDCCRFPLPSGQHVRLESVQNATDQARAVAAAITGGPAPYDAVPWFWTDQHDAKLQIAGLLDGHDRTVLRGDPDGDGHSVFCYAGERLVAVESINRPRDHLAARKLLAASFSPRAEDVADDAVDLRELLAVTAPAPPSAAT
ncbi:Rhodocoxin reductase [Baekduia alba]|uniref:NAD(P)/FAD-dependent oxidoreductase n=1 Tax=Baekduia alba TaxID=2997333 RepID=UPI0023424A1E|nr:FAD-dependent oxidoreductase [Baekduia alba]WCB93307.1 Rhodocoxin reductase [Baekduia alba]